MIISIEGCDQAGKKTQTEMLLSKYKNSIMFDFPVYDTEIGKQLRDILDGKIQVNMVDFHYLMAMNRKELRSEIVNASHEYQYVFINRYIHTNHVYGLVHDISPDLLEAWDDKIPQPDIVIVLDITYDVSLKRKSKNRDILEKDEQFMRDVCDKYKTEAEKHGWYLVDANRPRDVIHKDICEILKKES